MVGPSVFPDSQVLRMSGPSVFPDSQVLRMAGPSVFPDSQVRKSGLEPLSILSGLISSPKGLRNIF